LCGNYSLLVDTGDGESKALLSQNIPYSSINGILISHLHPDHFSGLGALIIQMKIEDRANPLDIFIHESLIDTIRDFIYSSYIFKEKMDFVINYIPYIYDKTYQVEKEFNFIPKPNTHLEAYKIFDRAGKLSFSCSSFLFSFNNIKLQYTGDIGSIEDIMLFNESAPDILISEISHIDAAELINIAITMNIKKLILTHISDEDEQPLLKILSLARQDNNFEIVAAYDGLTISA